MKYSEPPELDFEQVKARTVIALNRLGHQKFGAESGGYSLENWVRGVGLLLDEFERKVGEGRLPKEYVEKRRLLNDYLLRRVDTSQIDDSISELRQKEADVVRKLGDERDKTKARIDELQKELAEVTAELDRLNAQPSDMPGPERSGSFFRRLFARGAASAPREEDDVRAESEKKLQSLQNEKSEQQKVLKSIDRRDPDSPAAEDWKTLESIQARIGVLESEKLERTQFVKERAEFTASIADVISRISAS